MNLLHIHAKGLPTPSSRPQSTKVKKCYITEGQELAVEHELSGGEGKGMK